MALLISHFRHRVLSIVLGTACCAAGRVWWQRKTDTTCANLASRISYLSDCESEFTKCCLQRDMPGESGTLYM